VKQLNRKYFSAILEFTLIEEMWMRVDFQITGRATRAAALSQSAVA